MTNPNDSEYPEVHRVLIPTPEGLSRRDNIAIAVIRSLEIGSLDPEKAGRYVASYTDQIIAALNGKEKK